MKRIFQTALLAIALTGCATGEKMIEPNSIPQQTSGYVGGHFTLHTPPRAAAFVLTNVTSGKEYILPFTRKTEFVAGHSETSLVELPKGTYRATHWILYNSFWGPGLAGQEIKAEMKPSKFTEPFTITGGEVIFIGKFSADGRWAPGYFRSTMYGHWEAERISEIDGKRLMTDSYPSFSSLRFVCLTCVR